MFVNLKKKSGEWRQETQNNLPDFRSVTSNKYSGSAA